MQDEPAVHVANDLRQLPSVDELLRTSQAHEARAGAERLAELARAVVSGLRAEISAGTISGNREQLLAEAGSRLSAAWLVEARSGIRRVINATGVVIHTNLGRAPLSAEARRRLIDAAGYCTIEYDLDRGGRGRRGGRVERLLCQLTRAEDALVVNNCAAAAFFVLSTFADGREVVISRGELVEIGGDFRVPDVLARSGARLREVGTTNRTKLADYEKAISDETAMVLKVHPSNYRIVGFTEVPATRKLAEIAHKRGVLLYEDAGSGAVADLSGLGLLDEPVIRDVIEAGVDIVTFSGDKLLGGPQAGIIAGNRDLIERLRKDPLYRALRPDKLILAALEATLDAHLDQTATSDLPVMTMLAEPPESLLMRAERLKSKISDSSLSVEVREAESAVGGGSAPTARSQSYAIALKHAELSASDLEAALRAAEPPVVARIADDRLLLDLRTVDESEEEMLIGVLNSI